MSIAQFVAHFKWATIPSAVALAAILSGIGCGHAERQARNTVKELQENIIFGRWNALGPFISADDRDGFAMKPDEFAQFLQAYADEESHNTKFRAYMPKSIPKELQDSQSRQTVYLCTDIPGHPLAVIALVARHAGGDKWVVRARDMQSLLGPLHPDHDERYRCVRAALVKTHLTTFGWRGHYTTPDRIEAYLDHRIDQLHLFSANPDANPVQKAKQKSTAN